ncbi:MAG TPA: RNA polymerase sigma factor RpoH [Castellaniella sp.]|uniref:RNA polymerase sigma factor RpoH n=1 Tax=Castellaniella sp. TaxID=1955812 RepID=UPI002EFEF6CF
MTAASSTTTLAPAQLALAISNPGSLGSIEAYVGAVNRLPLLTVEQEVALGHRLRDHNDLDAARELILSHLRLVVSVARQYLGYGLPHADLIQEGNIGLMKAVRRFDPDRGVRLVSFAVHWIRAEIHEYVVRNWRLVKIATTKAQRKLFFNLRRMRPDGTSLAPAQMADIAKTLNVKPEEVAEMEVRLSGGDCALEAPVDSEDRFAPASWLADASQEPAQVLARRGLDSLQGEQLEAALQSLDDRSQHIVRARWLADEGGATLHELAAEYGISAERVRQVEAAALKKLRLALAGAADDLQDAA